ncbi:GNAT family N-acetyltransferase [bacterium]|nr:GNAT family N-acetyltransferase [bacterium]
MTVLGGLNEGLPLHKQYELGFAKNQAEVEAIQRLRYQIFNIELNEGLRESHVTEADKDEFDAQCHHLFVKHIASGEFIGTYRLQTNEIASANLGFYSSTVFDFSQAPSELLSRGVELGRACIHADHRSLDVLYLLWKGLGHYARHFDKRYMFGCCSITSQEETDGLKVLAYLRAHRHMHADVLIKPLASHQIPIEEGELLGSQKPPKLMRAYLSMGAKICSLPAIDRSFKTIDFLALFDASTIGSAESSFFHLKT